VVGYGVVGCIERSTNFSVARIMLTQSPMLRGRFEAFLADDVIGRLERYTDQIPETELPSALPITLRIPGSESRAKSRISTLSAKQLGALLGEVEPVAEMLDRAVELYVGSGSFEIANERANILVIPLASSSSLDQITRIVEAADRNSQICGSFRCRPALVTIRDHNPNVTPEFWEQLLTRIVVFDDLKARTNRLRTGGAGYVVSVFNHSSSSSSHFRINESKRHHRPLSHIEHQGRTKAGATDTVLVPYARIHDSR